MKIGFLLPVIEKINENLFVSECLAQEESIISQDPTRRGSMKWPRALAQQFSEQFWSVSVFSVYNNDGILKIRNTTKYNTAMVYSASNSCTASKMPVKLRC